MARAASGVGPPAADVPQNAFVLDNGANSIKAGYAPTDYVDDDETLKACEIISNCLVRTRERKTYVAGQTAEITQWSEAVFRRPVENGQIVNWEAQKEIWDYSLFDQNTAAKNAYIQDPATTTLVLAEAPNTMPALQKNADEIIMEEWGFGGYMRTVGPALNAYNNLHPIFEGADAPKAHSSLANLPIECLLVVDSGYSHTTIAPCFEGRPIHRATRRLDIGGKHVTNLLKETVSVRYFDLHQDTKIVNDIKEDVCFVSRDINADLDKTWKGNKAKSAAPPTEAIDLDGTECLDLRVDYVLPDGVNLIRGYPRPHDPSKAAEKKRKLALAQPDSHEIVMTLGNERFTCAEIIFNPADVGAKQPGLVDCITQSLSKLPPLVQATMVANTLVVGGNAMMPGFVERLQDDLRAKVKAEWPVHVRKLADPIKSTWLGGARLACNHPDILRSNAVSKEQYQEYGSAWMARRFALLS